jgi:hypothetical protein
MLYTCHEALRGVGRGNNTAPNEFEVLEVDETGIAWPSDRTKKFSHYTPQHLNDEPATRGGGTVTGYLDEDEHLIAWMRTAAMPTFRKLWGKLHMDLHTGDTIRVHITNRYGSTADGPAYNTRHAAAWVWYSRQWVANTVTRR